MARASQQAPSESPPLANEGLANERPRLLPRAGDSKLQKLLAEAGLGSRRRLEGLIAEGRVSVNGKRAKLGDRASAGDLVRVNGQRIDFRRTLARRVRVLAYHKPVGEVCTRRDPEGRPTIFMSLPGLRTGRWIGVGRLDINTSGLLLVTNNGELANALSHPSREIDRVYAVRVFGEVEESHLRQLREGVLLEDGMASFTSIVRVGGEGRNQWFEVTLREGRNREVRRLWEAVGLAVSRLTRVRYGGVELAPRLRQGHWIELGEEQVLKLRKEANLAPAEAKPEVRRNRRLSLRPRRE